MSASLPPYYRECHSPQMLLVADQSDPAAQAPMFGVRVGAGHLVVTLTLEELARLERGETVSR